MMSNERDSDLEKVLRYIDNMSREELEAHLKWRPEGARETWRNGPGYWVKLMTEPSQCITVELFDINYPVIIVPAKTGIIYKQQTAGIMCHHPEMEGFIIPLEYAPTKDKWIFDPDRWYLTDQDPYTEDTHREIEETIAALKSWHVRNLKVVKHPDNEEAWMYVEFDYVVFNIREDGEGDHETITRMTGILTWENCD